MELRSAVIALLEGELDVDSESPEQLRLQKKQQTLLAGCDIDCKAEHRRFVNIDSRINDKTQNEGTKHQLTVHFGAEQLQAVDISKYTGGQRESKLIAYTDSDKFASLSFAGLTLV